MIYRHILILMLLMSAIIANSQSKAEEETQQTAPQQQISLQQVKPKWNVGDQWGVSAVTAQQQVSRSTQGKPSTATIQWQFQVAAREQLGDHPCYRLEVRALQSSEARPTMVLWIDAESLTLRQFQTQIPVQGESRTLTENYDVVQGQAAPVFSPLTVLPIELPAFVSAQEKALGRFVYESRSGDVTTKNLNSLSFRTEIQQSVSTPPADSLHKHLGEKLSKNLESQPILKIELSSSDRNVQQYWQRNQPWPIFANNGQTKTRLISFTPAKEKTRPEESQTTPDDNKDAGTGSKQIPEPSENRDHGTAKFKPWSGYWWPMREGRMLEPLTKYDRLTQHKAAAWERKHHPAKPDTPNWHGYCHAWAASSVMEKEPRQTVVSTASDQMELTVGDQKGLLAACHTSDIANIYGDRYGDDAGSEDQQDLAPDTLWQLLQTYVQQQGVPLILDIEAGPEVWNYPVYAYEVEYQSRGNADTQEAKLTLLMADNGVQPDYRGVKVRRQTYRFSFQLQDGSIVKGSGKWLGRSRKDHPDFAWYPYIAVSENPEVIYARVKKLIATEEPVEVASRPEGNRPDAPSEEPSDPTSQPSNSSPNQPSPAGQQNDRPQQIVLSPMELVALVTNKTSSFGFDMTVDRFDGGIYEVGDRLQVRCTSEKAGYLYLVQIDAKGHPSILFPQPGQKNWIEAQKSVVIPSKNPEQGFDIDGPQGTTRIRAVVASRPLQFSGTVDPSIDLQQSGTSRAQSTVQFRLHPTQHEQVQKVLSQTQSATAQELLKTINPATLLGEFAQDEVMFYVDKPNKR